MEEIRFKLTVADVVAASRFHARRQPSWWLLIVLSAVLLAIGCCLVPTPAWLLGIFSIVFAMTAMPVFWFVRIPLRARRTLKDVVPLQNELVVGFDNDHITIESAGLLDNRIRWLFDVKSTPKLLMLYHGRMAYMVVPRRAFLDEAQFTRFENMARSLAQGEPSARERRESSQ